MWCNDAVAIAAVRAVLQLGWCGVRQAVQAGAALVQHSDRTCEMLYFWKLVHLFPAFKRSPVMSWM